MKTVFRNLLLTLLQKFKLYRSWALIPYGEVSLKNLTGVNVINHKDYSPVTRIPPRTIENKIYWKFDDLLSDIPQKTFVAEGYNWRVWGNQGAVITYDNLLLNDVSREFGNQKHSIFNQFKLPPPVFIKGISAVLSASGCLVYYHWMFDVLPRISLLEKAGLLENIDHFIIDYTETKFQKETLVRAGIDLSKIICSNNHWNFHIEAEELIIPSLVSPIDCPSIEACDYLRRLYANEISITGDPICIYIQRTTGRKIINEEELLFYLNNLNFQIINPENLTVAEQAKLFARATMIIGPHGAGFSNIVFCNPDTVIIDLFSPEWINPCYWVIAEHLNLKYSYLLGEKTPQKNKGKGADIYIDIDKLKLLLQPANNSKNIVC